VHVLCEKPFIFDSDADEALEQTEQLVDAFGATGRILMVNEQWPFTLPSFDRCFPGVRQEQALDRLEVLLAPACEGIDMIPNAVPHILSLLLAHAPCGGQLEDIRILQSSPDRMQLNFHYIHSEGRVAVEGLLIQCADQPRPAAFAINGCAVRRLIELPAYRFFFDVIQSGSIRDALHAPPSDTISNGQCDGIPLEDPLRLLIAEFIRRVGIAPSHAREDPIIKNSVRLLHEMCRAAREDLGN